MRALFFALAFSVVAPVFAETQLEKAPTITSDQQQIQSDKKEAKKKNKEGLALLKQKKFYEASDAFAEAITLDPDNAHYYNQHGLALLKSGDPFYAIDEFKYALDLGLNKAFVWNNLGMAYEHTNQLDDARNSYQRASQKGSLSAEKNFKRIQFVKSLNVEVFEGLGCGGEEEPYPPLVLSPDATLTTEPAPEPTAEPTSQPVP